MIAELKLAVTERSDARLAACDTPETRDRGMQRNFRRSMTKGDERFWQGMESLRDGSLGHSERSGDTLRALYKTSGGMRTIEMRKDPDGWRIVKLR